MKHALSILGLLTFFAVPALSQTSLYTMSIDEFAAANLTECERSAASISARLALLGNVDTI